MEKQGCDNCKLVILMAELLKDKNETIKKMVEERRKMLSKAQIAIDYNPN